MRKILIVFFLLLNILSATDNKLESWGVELNPFRLFVYHDNERSLSGTFSYFNKEESVEISIPWLYYTENNNYNFSNDMFPYGSVKEKSILIDLHYRKYFSPNTEGGYLGTFGRYTHLEGRAKKVGKDAIVDKFGLGVEVGFKVKNIMNTSFYYGASIAMGSYFGGDNEIFNTDAFIELDTFELDDRKYILELELLKIGYEF